MRKITKFVIFGLFVSTVASANSENNHLEKLRSRYPYGLIGKDYGLLAEEDLAVNTCNVSKLTPFEGDKNMVYSYWQCFPLRNAKMECESMGYDSTVRMETSYLAINAHNENGVQSYLARDVMDMRDCKSYLLRWKKKTRGEKFVCISGSYGGFSGLREGRKETDWVFDKFKTRKGCESSRSECSLAEVSSLRGCLMPSDWSHKPKKLTNEVHIGI